MRGSALFSETLGHYFSPWLHVQRTQGLRTGTWGEGLHGVMLMPWALPQRALRELIQGS